jgi:drug/metabolite transporter (DMT)-like permease
MKALLAFLICIACFASTGILKNYVHGVPSAFLAFARLAISVALFAIIFKGKIRKPKNRKMWASFAVSGIFYALAFGLYLEAFDHASVADVALLGFVDPLFATLLAFLLLGERFTPYAFGAIALAAAGVVYLLGATPGANSESLGIYLAILSFVAGSATTVLARWEERHSAPLIDVVFYPFAFGAAFLFVPALLQVNSAALMNGWQWAAVMVMGATTAAGYFIYDRLMQKYGAHSTDLAVRAGITVAATVGASLLLGQKIGQDWIPAACFLFGASYLIYLEANGAGRKFLPRHGHTL